MYNFFQTNSLHKDGDDKHTDRVQTLLITTNRSHLFIYLFIYLSTLVAFSDLHQNLIISYWGHPQHVLQIWSKSITFWTNKQNIMIVCTI